MATAGGSTDTPMTPRDHIPGPIELRADAVTRETIDVNDGIERVMGDRDLYGRMLRRFRNDYRGGALSIRSALAANDPVLAHRIVHTLKGGAGMIGAHRLLARATELEEALRMKAPGQREILASLVTEFEKVLHLLDLLLDGSPPPGMHVMPPRTLMPDAALLEQLLDLLAHEDGAAVDLLGESHASLKVILGEATLARVVTAMNSFDYRKALDALGETAYGAGI